MLELDNTSLEIDKSILDFAVYNTGVFTTLLVNTDGSIHGEEPHLARLVNDVKFLYGIEINKKFIKSRISSFLTRNPALPIVLKIILFPDNINLVEPGNISAVKCLIQAREYKPSDAKSEITLQSITGKRALAKIKTTNIAFNMFARSKAHQAGFDDALFVDDGCILEGPTWNIFFIKANELYTPSLTRDLLPGVTRQLLLNACDRLDFKYNEIDIKLTDISDFELAFVTSSVQGARLVSSIDDHQYANTATAKTLLDKVLAEFNA